MGHERTISEQELLENLGWVRALARRLVGGQADDLVQQVCVAALERGRIRGVPGSGSAAPRVRAWLARATAYLANNQRRGEWRRRERERVGARPEAQPPTHETVARNALLADLVREVQGLAEPCRTTVLLRYLEGRSNPEIAAELGVTEVVVRKRLSRGLERLRSRIGPRGLDAWAVCVLAPLHPALVHAPIPATKTLGTLTMATTTTKAVAGLAAAGLTAALLIDSPERAPAELALGEAPVPASAGPDLIHEPLDTAAMSAAPDPPVRAPVADGSPSPAEPRVDANDDSIQVSIDDPRSVWGQDFAARVLPVQALAGLRTSVGEYQVAFARPEPLPEDGWRVETFEDGSRKAAGLIVDGHRQGEWKEWHPDGTLAARGAYDAGQKEGEWERWDEAGELVSLGAYRYGRKDGLHERREESLWHFVEYRDGDRHGLARATSEGDLLASEEEWFRDRRHGSSRSFHSNGELASQGEFEHGRKVGVWNYWNEAGELDEERSGLVEPPEEDEVGEALLIELGGLAE